MIGRHLLVEIYDVPEKKIKHLSDKKYIEKMCLDSCKLANASILNSFFHTFPGSESGITGIVILEESHLSIHTWPEFNYIAVDIFTCGNKADPHLAISHILSQLQPNKTNIVNIIRGGFE